MDVDVDGRGGLGNGGGLSRPDCRIVVGFLFLRLLSTFICTKDEGRSLNNVVFSLEKIKKSEITQNRHVQDVHVKF